MTTLCPTEGYSSKQTAKRGALRQGLAPNAFATFERDGRWFFDYREAVSAAIDPVIPTDYADDNAPAAEPAINWNSDANATAPLIEEDNELTDAPSLPPTTDELTNYVGAALAVSPIAPAAPKTGMRKLGKKDELIVALARRPEGVTGKEIMQVTGWPTASAKYECERIAKVRGWLCEKVEGAAVVAYHVDPTVILI